MSGSTDVLFETFGREGSPYRIEEIVGKGAMSWVLRARDTTTGQAVALKVLKPTMSRDVEGLRRFFREAEVLGRIDHPGVVRILGHGTFDGFPYTALELVEGGTLEARLLKHGPMPWKDALRCLRDVAGALAVAHGQGLTHRDLKPSNVLITTEGRGKISDFGLVQIEGASRLTQRVRVLGTPLYTAPEVLEGGVADARTDLYGLGAVASEMLRGKPPFAARDMFALLEIHRSAGRAMPVDYPADCPPELLSAIHALLERDPAQRPAGAAAFIARLESLGEV